jgi:hypothetical protein
MVVCSLGCSPGHTALFKCYRRNPHHGKLDLERLADWDQNGILHEYSCRKFSGVYLAEAGYDMEFARNNFRAHTGLLYRSGMESQCH